MAGAGVVILAFAIYRWRILLGTIVAVYLVLLIALIAAAIVGAK